MTPPTLTQESPTFHTRGSFTEHAYHGSCHCKAVEFKILAPPPEEVEVTTCNCTYCTKRGTMNVYLKDGTLFEFTKGSLEDLNSYQFGSKRISHYFCGKCGVTIGSVLGTMWVVNTRCIDEGLDVEAAKRMHFDGRHMF